ncbi:hypothetical protein CH274_11735 [Rhodococcus sp. 06-418-5]|uniref:DUF262 domain-containing protein n=1 Tax=Rhodococcus sp. 06-418-5 TaxID=2022507 RepID=UPI000B9B4305|nr:DUF262 domain-containing protein [Rhodococcus sp. 06-418-5]OZC81464.1 hypothetical protein CH274_11735 [Rhodococcus sp. 06-418-5]
MSVTTTTGLDLIPVESQTRTIQTCFQQCLYEVPNFQRPYSWSTEQLEDYWDDVVLAQGDFFFGSTVTWVSQKRDLFNDTYSIIDGQQRLTTSAIILSVIRDAFTRIADQQNGSSEDEAAAAKNQAAATQRYLIATDDDGKEHQVLVRSEKMFYEHIQKPDAIPSGGVWNGSANRIGKARNFFEGRILEDLNGLSPSSQLEKLKSIRANVLKARVIQVELASEEDGFLIFETLNTRGADLRLSDLAKNLLIRGGATTEPNRQAIAERWERFVDRVQEGQTNPDVVDRFIWQSWNSRRDAVKEPELFKEISSIVKESSVKHLDYLKELEIDSQFYAKLADENVTAKPEVPGKRDSFSVPDFVDSVRALAIFKVTVANSTMLAIARKYEESTHFKKSHLISVARMVENFHFQFTALTNSGSTGGTRGRYNRFAVRLEQASTSAEIAAAIADFRSKLKISLPSRDRSEKAFRGLFYAPSLPLNQAQKARARKIFIAYILMDFAKHHNLIPAGQNLRSWSIEHIKPQSLGGTSFTNAVYSIGNLALLTGPLNSTLGDSDFKVKAEAFRKSLSYFDSELKKWDKSGVAVPSDTQIAARAKLLAAEALDKVWSI